LEFVVGADHAGYHFHEKVIEYLEDRGFSVQDVGTYNDESCDYPRYAHEVARRVANESDTRGVLVCGSGQGMVMTANRYPGVRAALCLNESMAAGTRAHNNANCLVLAERVMDPDDLEPTLEAFLDGTFDGGRHQRRIRKIDRPPVRVTTNPVIQDKLAALRDADTDHADFNQRLSEVTKLLFHEVSQSFSSQATTREAPLGEAAVKELDREVLLVPILRAGLGMLEPVRDLVPDARVAHLGFQRDEETFEAEEYYRNVPQGLEDPLVVLLDPMLATGGTAIRAADVIKDEGLADDIRFLNLVAAPEGIDALQEEHPDVSIYTGAVDEGLNDDAYIVPGLGDAGDRIFGTE
jgi:uracil phosphoribosyltransferase